MTITPNRRTVRRAPDRQYRRLLDQETFVKVTRGIERAKPIVTFAINLLRFLEAWDRYFG